MSKSATLPRVRSKARPAKLRSRLVEHELDRAQTRIRTIDTLSALAQLAAGVLAYVLIVITVDYWVRMNDLARQILWSIAGLGVVAFVALRIVWPLIQRINPYYAARAIEKATPESKNGIINWLDLREQPISPIIRDALSRRAVHELDSADMERAIPTKRPVQFALIVGFIVLGIIGVAWFLPDQIGSLFKRALFPFQRVIIPTKTRLEVLSPVKESEPELEPESLPVLEVPVERGQPVEFRVLAHGVPPAEVFFESQAAGDRAPISKPMRQDKKADASAPWRVALSSSDIPVDGFLFWFRANDGITRQFRLVVTSKVPPAVSDLNVYLKYPKYTKRRPTQQGMGPINAIVGSEATLEVTADRPVERGDLIVMGEEEVRDGGAPIRKPLETIPLIPAPTGDDNKLVLEHPLVLSPKFLPKNVGDKFFYELSIKSRSGLYGTSPAYQLKVDPDGTPWVEINKVKDTVITNQEELEVEANAVLPVNGKAKDDVALGQVSLRLKHHVDGRDVYFLGTPPLEKDLQKANGFEPPPVDYLLTLDLTKLTFDAPERKGDAAPRQPAKLRPGTVLELSVEARDTAQPEAHVGTSRTLKLRLKGDVSEQERQQQQKQADDQQQKHDQQKQERQQRDASRQKDQDEKNEKNEKNEQGEGKDSPNQDKQSGQPGEGNPKDKNPQSDKEQNGKNDQKNKNQDGNKQDNKNPPDQKSSDNKDQSGNKQDTKDQKNGDKGNAQPNKDNPPKDGNQNQSGDAKNNQAGKPDPNQKNQSNDQKQQGADNKSGDRNPDGNKPPGDQSQPDGNKQPPKDGKDQNKPDQKGSDPSQPKDKGQNQADKSKPEFKDDPSGKNNQPQPGDQKQQDKKPGDDKNQTGEKSGDPKQGDQPEKKDGKQNADKQPEGKQDQTKQGEPQQKAGDKKQDGNQNESGDKPNEKQAGDKKQDGAGESKDQPKDQKRDGSGQGDQKDKQPEKKDGAGEKSGKPEPKPKDDKPKDDKPKDGADRKQDQPKPGDEKSPPKDGAGEKKQDTPEKTEQGKQPQPGDKQDDKDQGKQPGDQKKENGDKKPGDQKGKEDGKQGDQKSDQKGDQPSQMPGDQPGKDQPKDQQDSKDRQPGAQDPNDKGKLEDLMKQAKGDSKQEGKKFDPNQAGNLPPDKAKPQEVDAEAARKNNLAVDTLLDKLRKGEIDKNLGDALKRQNLTKEEAIKLLENSKLERLRGKGQGKDIGPGQSLTTVKRGSEQIIDPSQDVPEELSSSYRTFTQKRNQVPPPQQQPRR